MRRRTNPQQRIDKFIKGFTYRHKKSENKPKKKKRYPRDESIYNLIQEDELEFFIRWMPIATEIVADKYGNTTYSGIGSPCRYSLYEILVCLSLKSYFHFPLRRGKGLIEYLVEKEGLGVNVPSFRMLGNYMKDPLVRECFEDLIKITSNPLKAIEDSFATDSTGIAAMCFSTWFILRMKRKIRKRDHLTVHITSTTKLNSVTNVDVRVERGRDNIIFREHVDSVADRFNPKEWSGDCTYASRENCNKCEEHGIKPYFKLKDNATDRAKSSPSWRKMVKESREEPEEYDPHYHKRSNVETSNSSKKRKFNNFVRSRIDETKENEELMSWSCYNFGVLTRAYHEYGIITDFASQSR